MVLDGLNNELLVSSFKTKFCLFSMTFSSGHNLPNIDDRNILNIDTEFSQLQLLNETIIVNFK